MVLLFFVSKVFPDVLIANRTFCWLFEPGLDAVGMESMETAEKSFLIVGWYF